jgi:nicotinate-nucleotide pyrophosphorylase (carboxylating)
MVLCGAVWATEAFQQVDPTVTVAWRARDGARVVANSVLCEIQGPARSVLTAERCALNFLQTLSGTATQTAAHVAALAGTACRVLDTRKTIPGLRLAQKYAVRCGGGQNHRLGLYDMVLIKENHIIAAGSIDAAIQSVRASSPGIPVEVEVESLQEFRQALAAQPEVIMLDDFSLADMREAVSLRDAAGSSTRLEASGSVQLDRLRTIADTGIDYISVGALTKHVRAIDLSLRFTAAPASD